MLARVIDHGTAQRLHGLGIVLAAQRDAVHTQQLIVHAQASVPRCGTAMDHVLYKYAQIAVVLHVAVSCGRGCVQIGARLALHTDPEASLLRVVHRYVERQLLPRMPVTAARRQAVLWAQGCERVRESDQ